jgi:hypothetical protein
MSVIERRPSVMRAPASTANQIRMIAPTTAATVETRESDTMR